jgi:hypothetical protein
MVAIASAAGIGSGNSAPGRTTCTSRPVHLADPDHRVRLDLERRRHPAEVLRDHPGLVTTRIAQVQFGVQRLADSAEPVGECEPDAIDDQGR